MSSLMSIADARFAADIERPTPPVPPAGAEHFAELFKLQVPADERSAVRAQRLRSALLGVCTHDSPGWNGFVKYLGIVAGGRAFVERSLAAILAADAVGYSRIVGSSRTSASQRSSSSIRVTAPRRGAPARGSLSA